MDARTTRTRLALVMTLALLAPGMAVAQTAKEKELEARIASSSFMLCSLKIGRASCRERV